ncbi:hypothetical protein C8R45DRAFT_1030203 [Mycena sanguinolenta]|nr:hypothetical protein C8R45DRAFT_1030203 [Mycena sanguinolenta]
MKDIDQGPPDIQSQIDALGEELMALRRETATAADDMLEGARQSPLDIQSQLKALNDEVTALERSMDALRGPPGNDPMRTLVEKVRTAFGRPMEQLPRWRDSGSQRAEGHTRTLKAVEQDTAEDDDEAEMQVDTSQLEHEEREDTPQLEHEEQEEQEQEQETSGDVGAGVLTRMGSQRPVSRSNAVVRGGSVPVPELEPAAGNGRREEEEDEEMPLHALQEHQNPAPIMTSEIEGGNPELDNDEEEEEEEEAEDLELLYPDPDPNHQGDGPSAISQPAANGTLSAAIRASTSGSNSPSPSRSVSPVPPLSTARFPAPAPDDPRATQLTAQPPRTVSPLPAPPVISAPISTSTSADADAESAMVAKFLQSCERLGEDMRALRAEVAQLRAGVRDAPQTPITELEARVRRLEEERPLLQRVHPAGYEGADTRAGRAETGKRWSHPLQHLLRLDSEMEMDVDDEGEGNGAVMAPNYRPPLPPRSRKFDNAARV